MANGPNIFQMLLVYLIIVSSVTVRVRFRFNNSRLSRKSRIWHDTGIERSDAGGSKV